MHRKQIIKENVNKVVRAILSPSQRDRFDRTMAALKRADRGEVVDLLKSLPPQKRRMFVTKMKESGRL